MSTVKIACPKCTGFGLVGTVNETVCPQCTGKGTITVDDTQTFASINTTEAARITSASPIVVTAPPVVPPVATKISNRGK